MNKRKKAIDVIAASLSQRNIKEQKALIIRKKYLHELATLIFDESSRDENNLLSLCDSFGNAISDGNILLTHKDKLFLTEALSEMLCRNNGCDLTVFSLESGEMPKKLAYVKNMFSDSAFRCFDKMLGHLRCEYCDSFDSAASGVFFGQYDGCILPFESGNGNVMTGVMNTINKYGMKKVLECSISMPESERVKFGIFGAELVLDGNNDRLDIMLDETELFMLSELALASKELGMASGICQKITVNGEDKTMLSFKGDRKSQYALMLYMTLSGIRYDVTGSYKETM